MPPPTENLFRAIAPELANIEVRDGADGERPVLSVAFAVFNEWAEIDSVSEGHFMERFAPGSLDESLQRETPKILFQHGKDPELGHKVIAAPVSAHADGQRAVLEGPLLDGVPPLIVSGLRSGVYGASLQFHVEEHEIVRDAPASDHNPLGLTERTVTKARVREGGPVTWGAYAGASSAIRSLTDEYRPHDFQDELTVLARERPGELAKRIERALTLDGIKAEPPQGTPKPTPEPRRFREREEFLQWLSKS